MVVVAVAAALLLVADHGHDRAADGDQWDPPLLWALRGIHVPIVLVAVVPLDLLYDTWPRNSDDDDDDDRSWCSNAAVILQ